VFVSGGSDWENSGHGAWDALVVLLVLVVLFVLLVVVAFVVLVVLLVLVLVLVVVVVVFVVLVVLVVLVVVVLLVFVLVELFVVVVLVLPVRTMQPWVSGASSESAKVGLSWFRDKMDISCSNLGASMRHSRFCTCSVVKTRL